MDRYWPGSLILLPLCAALTAHADPVAQTATGLPPQIIPSAPEVGVIIMQFSGSTSTPRTGSTVPDTHSTGGETPSNGGSGAAYEEMMATPYGAQAAQDAATAGVNVDAIAAIGMAESNFQNVPKSQVDRR